MDFNKLKEMGLEYAEKGRNAAMDLAERGKTQAKIVNEQTKLAKAQRQLGALVYSLAKGNEENQPLVDKYIEMIDAIEKDLADLRASLDTPAAEAEGRKEDLPPVWRSRFGGCAVLQQVRRTAVTKTGKSKPRPGGVPVGCRPFLCQSVKNLETFRANGRKIGLSP